MPIDKNSSYRLVILFWSAFNLIDKFQWLSVLLKSWLNDIMAPFRVSKQIGAVAYKLQLPEECKVHPVFHISALKPYVGNSTVYVASLPPDTIDNKPVSTPIAILADRFILKQGKEHCQILVEWSGCAPENSTWEDFAEFCRLYPEFNLEEKVHSQEEGSDTS